MNQKVDEFIAKANRWQKELETLRIYLLDCGLEEELKWKQPCYSYSGANLVIIGELSDGCVLSFFKGALLLDTEGILSKPGENTQSARIIKFTSVSEIVKLEATIKAYVYEAIEAEKLGLKIEFKDNTNLDLVEELLAKFTEMPELKLAFESLTPGRQRAYNMHFSSAKQSKTRIARIENYTQRILNGIGMNDCVCGLSKRMPNCDGSHKFA